MSTGVVEVSKGDDHKEVERGRKGKFRRRVLASGVGESCNYAVDAERQHSRVLR